MIKQVKLLQMTQSPPEKISGLQVIIERLYDAQRKYQLFVPVQKLSTSLAEQVYGMEPVPQ